MIDLSLSNAGIYSLQLLGVVAAAAAGDRFLQLPTARQRYWYWRTVVATCLALPALSVFRPVEQAGSLRAVTATETFEAVAGVVAGPPSTASFVPLLFWILALGLVFRVLCLGVGLHRLRRLRRQSAPVAVAEDVEVLRRGLAFDAQLRTHHRVLQPITFGYRRPIVLLPESFPTLSNDTQRVVACHELLHVQRADWLWTVGEEIVRAIFWFHPAMRWALNRLQLAREELVDARVVELTGARRAYMHALLTFANSPALSPAAWFGGRHTLAVRIRRIAEQVHMSRLRLTLTAAGLATVLAASTWGLSAAMPLHATHIAEGGQSVTTSDRSVQITLAGANLRLPITRIEPEYPADLLRSGVGATITLVVRVSERGQVEEILEPTWQLTLSEKSTIGDIPAFWARKPWLQFVNAAQSAVRQWTFEPGPATTTEMTIVFKSAGDVMVFAPAPPPPPPPPPPGANAAAAASERLAAAAAQAGKAAAQRSSGTIDRVPGSDAPGRIPQSAAPPPPPPPPPPPSSADRPDVLRVGGPINAPQKIKDVRPIYPLAAQEAGIEGTVIIEVEIAEDGTVAAARVVRSMPLLDEAAVDAVRQWLFTPTLLNGAPIRVAMMVTVNFTLAR